MFNWKDKRVLVTGSEGMIGKELVEQLKELGAKVFRFDIKRFWIESIVSSEDCRECGKKTKYPLDLRFQSTIHKVFESFKPEYVFHLFGIKGNPKMTKEKPVNFMIPMLQGDTNLIEMCQKHNVKKVLYTSSIAVENPESDKYPAWAKQTAETLIEAMRIQYPKGPQWTIIRPANVYGRYDNFDNPNSMVITSLIRQAIQDGYIEQWGDGLFKRDFINAKEVTSLMIKVMEQSVLPKKPINASRGVGTPIRDIISIIAGYLDVPIKKIDKNQEGPEIKIMSPNYKKLGFSITPNSLIDGLKEVCDYAKENLGTK